MLETTDIATHLLVTGGLLGLGVATFVSVFLIRGVIHWRRLRGVRKGLGSLKPNTPPDDLKRLFAGDSKLAHLWSEYQETLHIQRDERDGQLQIVAVRSTVAAEAYFNGQYVVDNRLYTEFFKHLPGIFTGLGIIGTFTGLIDGLRHFQVSEEATTVRASLESLMHSVGEAFLISAAAIAAAMAVTFLEKLILAALYQQTEAIAHDIDARFESGAGEEYLSRLVTASEASASQSKILKDALVKELGDILRELTASQLNSGQQLSEKLAQCIQESSNKQLASAREDNRALGGMMAESIESSLKAPLDKIADSVKTASGDQSATAVKMLNDIMVSFSQRLNDLFGGQISGLNDLNQQTAKSMQDAVAALNDLAQKLEEGGRKTTDEMAAKMATAIQGMEDRQATMNSQSQALIEQIQELIQSSHTTTQEKLRSTLESIGEQMTNMLSKLSESQVKVLDDNRAREEAMTSRASTVVASMTESVETAAREMSAASQAMANSVSILSTATTSNVDKMNAGAIRIDAAATAFANAGDRVSAAMNQAATVTSKLAELAAALTTSSVTLQEGLRDYRAQRESLSALIAEVRSTVEMAKKEASITADVLQRIEASANKLSLAQTSADEYLDGISDVLAESSKQFRDSTITTLSQVNHTFFENLKTAVGLLSSSVQELEVTLGSLAPRR